MKILRMPTDRDSLMAIAEAELELRGTIMDRYAVRTVFGTDGFYWKRAVVYQAFSQWLATKGPRYWTGTNTVHALDQAAMHASMPDGGLPAGWTPADVPSCCA